MWENVVGQEQAVKILRRTAERPAHAYLLSGPPGSGLEATGRRFAAALLCSDAGCGECTTCQRVLRGHHPDVVEVEPEGSEILVDQVADIVESVHRTPLEGDRKVVIVTAAERMNDRAANKVLKTLEEPPASATFIVLSSAPDELLPTIVSRCQQVSLSALTEDLVQEALVAEDVPLERAATAARLAGGRLDRARRLAGEYSSLREVFARIPSTATGTGAWAAQAADVLMEAVDEAFEAVTTRHESEREQLDREIERLGYPDRAAERLRKRLARRQERVERRAKVDAIADGLAVLQSVYRDALVAPGEPINPDLPPLGVAPEACLAALDACSTALERVQSGTVLNWTLHLQNLLLDLPAVSHPAGTLADLSPG